MWKGWKDTDGGAYNVLDCAYNIYFLGFLIHSTTIHNIRSVGDMFPGKTIIDLTK